VTTALALLHSPFLGPSSWQAVESGLLARGADARRLDLRGASANGPNPYEAFAVAAARQIVRPAILAVHSGAGGLTSEVVRVAAERVRGVIFVDAILPHPRRSWFDTAPVDLAARLHAGARDGFAPPWPCWFPGEVLARLLPDEAMREALIAEAPAVPIAFLEAPAPLASLAIPCAFLWLSPGYQTEADQARTAGWPVTRLDGHHLWPMTHADRVGDALLALAEWMPA